MRRFLFILVAAASLVSCSKAPRDGEYSLHVLAFSDVHGAYFDSTYADTQTRQSLFALKRTADSVRAVFGPENVVLIDAGDCMQGDNASYYFNYVATDEPHIYPRLCHYLGTDVMVVGNHDVETGHPVYDRVTRDLEAFGIPYLAGNAVRTDNGKPYWPVYTVLERGGVKVLVLGYTNPNIKAWLDEELWEGMDFKSLIPLVQEDVDRLKARVKPQITIVATHSGTGDGKGGSLESQGLELFGSLEGVDFVITAHDHSALVLDSGNSVLLNGGSRSRYLAHGTVDFRVEKGKVVDKSFEAGIIPVDKDKVDVSMRDAFREDYEKVKAFTLREVGSVECDLNSSEAVNGMCNYINLLHTVQLGATGAQVSFAAPLTTGTGIPAGRLIFDDMFKIYQYENQLFVVNLTGREIINYLEYSYEPWINPTRNMRFYNLDSAGGINYTVDVTKPFGSRVSVSSLADGTPFDPDATYTVAMTSYRASGGGELLPRGAGIEDVGDRIAAKYPEIRNLIYEYIRDNGVVTAEMIGDKALIGEWKFVPGFLMTHTLDAHR